MLASVLGALLVDTSYTFVSFHLSGYLQAKHFKFIPLHFTSPFTLPFHLHLSYCLILTFLRPVPTTQLQLVHLQRMR